MAKTEVAVVENKEDAIIPFGDKVDWLPEAPSNKGLEGLGKDDVKTPTINLLQPLSPILKSFQGVAFANEFWHTGMNVSLGTSFDFVTALISKRVILFRPREDQGGGILAFSRDGKTWDTGGNTEFRVKLKGKKEPVVWNTGRDVISSRLTNFGTMNPEESDSPPAATISYEYLVYLIKHPELSPVVIRAAKTGMPNGKALNTSLLTLAKSGKPIQSVAVRCFVEEKSNNDGAWTVPNFKTIGYVQKGVYETVTKMADQYGDYKVDYSDLAAEDTGSQINDEVAF